MSKQFISKDNETYLMSTEAEIKSLRIEDTLIGLLNYDKRVFDEKALGQKELIKKMVEELFDKNRQLVAKAYIYSQTYNNTSSPIKIKVNVKSSSYVRIKVLNLNAINTLAVVSTKGIGINTPGAKGKFYYDVVHNKKEEFLNAIKDFCSAIDEKEEFSCGFGTCSGVDYKNSLQEIAEAFASVNVSEINFKNYNLKDYAGEKENIENKQLYYVEHDGGFLTLSRSRHARVLFSWAKTSNINLAYLFSGNIDDYDIPYDSSSINKVFVEVQVKGVEKNVQSKLIDNLNIKIEKRDIGNLLENKKDMVQEEVVNKRVNKL